MVVPCHHCTDMHRFLDSPVTVVTVAAIGQAIRISMAGGSGLDEEIDTESGQCRVTEKFQAKGEPFSPSRALFLRQQMWKTRTRQATSHDHTAKQPKMSADKHVP
ncbi:hypothetical protein CSKR_100113 [Clonorchis sinensis]|uniref:Uncharacterized protein n=1 Tax=Clonorchis sinensis TaxID=79923 RepID=A0A3R7H9A2_CLOSI|nr:hypothetical protein CSKR_100113 [Clonorchis sinensis]